MNHVALNLRFNRADVEDMMERLASQLLPEFGAHDDTGDTQGTAP